MSKKNQTSFLNNLKQLLLKTTYCSCKHVNLKNAYLGQQNTEKVKTSNGLLTQFFTPDKLVLQKGKTSNGRRSIFEYIGSSNYSPVKLEDKSQISITKSLISAQHYGINCFICDILTVWTHYLSFHFLHQATPATTSPKEICI